MTKYGLPADKLMGEGWEGAPLGSERRAESPKDGTPGQPDPVLDFSRRGHPQKTMRIYLASLRVSKKWIYCPKCGKTQSDSDSQVAVNQVFI
jgi:hypothetical protein